jgi:hypothetical protein
LQESLIAEKLNDDGQPQAPKTRSQKKNHTRRAKKTKFNHENLPSMSDDQNLDADYTDAEISEGSDSLTVSDEEEDAMVITNEEVWNYMQ